MERPAYVPRYIARCHAHNFPNELRLGAVLGYDYMGSAEYEWGAIPGSLAAMRLAIIEAQRNSEPDNGLMLIEHDSNELVANYGNHIGSKLYTLMLTSKNSEAFQAAYHTALIGMSKDSNDIRCKEPVHFDRAFQRSRWHRDGSEPEHFEAWHDIKNHLFFSHSKTLLLLIQAQLLRSIELPVASVMSQWCVQHDWHVNFVDDVPGYKNADNDCSTENWIVRRGRVAAVASTEISVQVEDGTIYNVPYHMLLTLPKQALNNVNDIPKLKEAAKRV